MNINNFIGGVEGDLIDDREVEKSKKDRAFILLGFLLAVLNLLDGIFTFSGLHFGLIEEMNPLLASLPPIILLLVKVLLSGFLIYFMCQPKYIPFRNFFYYLFIIANIIYLVILGLHIYWIYLALMY